MQRFTALLGYRTPAAAISRARADDHKGRPYATSLTERYWGYFVWTTGGKPRGTTRYAVTEDA